MIHDNARHTRRVIIVVLMPLRYGHAHKRKLGLDWFFFFWFAISSRRAFIRLKKERSSWFPPGVHVIDVSRCTCSPIRTCAYTVVAAVCKLQAPSAREISSASAILILDSVDGLASIFVHDCRIVEIIVFFANALPINGYYVYIPFIMTWIWNINMEMKNKYGRQYYIFLVRFLFYLQSLYACMCVKNFPK